MGRLWNRNVLLWITFIESLFVGLLYCSKQHVRAAHAIIKTRFLKLPSILTAGCWLPIMDLTLKTWQDALCGRTEGNYYWWPLPTKLQNKLLRAPESVSHTSCMTWPNLICCTSSNSGWRRVADSGERTVPSSDAVRVQGWPPGVKRGRPSDYTGAKFSPVVSLKTFLSRCGIILLL